MEIPSFNIWKSFLLLLDCEDGSLLDFDNTIQEIETSLPNLNPLNYKRKNADERSV